MYYIAKFGNCCSMVWARRQGQWKGKNYSLPFSEKADKMSRVVLHCVFGRDFLSLHTTIVLGVEDSSSTSMSSCSEDLAQCYVYLA